MGIQTITQFMGTASVFCTGFTFNNVAEINTYTHYYNNEDITTISHRVLESAWVTNKGSEAYFITVLIDNVGAVARHQMLPPNSSLIVFTRDMSSSVSGTIKFQLDQAYTGQSVPVTGDVVGHITVSGSGA